MVSNSATQTTTNGLSLPSLVALALEPVEDSSLSATPTLADLADLFPDFRGLTARGRGGMGQVYRAVQSNLQREVAIKLLPHTLGDLTGFAPRFRQEAAVIASLNHPNIIAVYDSGQTVAGHWFYVMEFIDGVDLAEKMAAGALPSEQALPMLLQVCDALAYAHGQGVIHRDIKPSNILVRKDGVIKLADFGLAMLLEKRVAESKLTMGGTTLGTLEYAAPEQLEHGEITARSDIYSLGVLTYEMLTGELPRGVFDPPSVRNRQLDPAFDGLIMQAMQSDPQRRFATVAQFKENLLAAADRPRQEALRAVAARKKLQKRTRIAVSAAVLSLLTMGLAGYAWRQRDRAIQGEAEASKQRDANVLTREESEKLVDFMLGELQSRLFEVNRPDVLADAVERVAAYYARVPKTEENEAFLLRKGEFLEVRGALLEKQQNPAAALPFFLEAQQIRERLLAKDRTNQTYVNPYIEGQMALSTCQASLEDYTAAIATQRATIAAYEQSGQAKYSIISKGVLAQYLQQSGQHQEAQKTAETALVELEKFSDDASRSGFYYTNTKNSILAALSGLAAEEGRHADAATLSQAILDGYLPFYPKKDRHGYREVMAAGAATVAARDWLKAGKPAEAEKAAVMAYAAYERLTKDPIGNSIEKRAAPSAMIRWKQARRDQNLPAEEATLKSAAAAWLENAASAKEEAGGALQKEAKLYAALLANPESESAQINWALASEDLGRSIAKNSSPEAALTFFQAQFTKVEAEREKAAEETLWQIAASYTLNRMAAVNIQLGKTAEADQLYQQAYTRRLRLLQSHPTSAFHGRNLASSINHLCAAYLREKKSEAAASLLLEVMPEFTEIKPDSFYDPIGTMRDISEMVAKTLPEPLRTEVISKMASLLKEKR